MERMGSKKCVWFYNDIFSDNRLDEYKDNIYKEIFESELCGKDLIDFDIDDVKSMGIKKFSIRKDVLRAIKQLTKQYDTNANDDDDNHHHEITDTEGLYEVTEYHWQFYVLCSLSIFCSFCIILPIFNFVLYCDEYVWLIFDILLFWL